MQEGVAAAAIEGPARRLHAAGVSRAATFAQMAGGVGSRRPCIHAAPLPPTPRCRAWAQYYCAVAAPSRRPSCSINAQMHTGAALDRGLGDQFGSRTKSAQSELLELPPFSRLGSWWSSRRHDGGASITEEHRLRLTEPPSRMGSTAVVHG